MKANKAITILPLIFLLLACSGCAGQANKTAPAENIPLTKDQNGQNITVHVNETFQVSLEGNPTTGFSWETSKLDETLLAQQGEPVYTQQTSNKLVGSGGTYLFTFKAVQTGDATLNLVYHRSWEKDTPPADTFQATIHIIK